MVGKNLSHYKILEELGRGGMGIVYKAEDTKLDRTVAIKVLPSAALASEDDRARFYREAKAAAQLHHPHIASVFEIDEAVPEGSKDDDLRPFIAMEYIEGKTLDAKIEEGPFKLEDAVRIASEIASALEAAHKKDIVHRDIKSQNVMLTEEGSAKVLDFGLAQTAQSTKLTRMGSTLGTIAYMSPEQARSEEVDLRTDIWSLGVVLYEMIAGKHAFPGDYEQAAVYSILNEDPEPLTAIRTGVPMGVEWIVSKCLAKKAEARYQNATDLLVDLKNVDLTTSGMSRVSGAVTGISSGVISSSVSLRTDRNSPELTLVTSLKKSWSIVTIAFVVALGLGYVIFGGRIDEAQTPPLQSLPIHLEGVTGVFWPAISPTANYIAFTATDTLSRSGLFLFDIKTAEIQFMDGTEGAIKPSFSPDGLRLAFRMGGAVYTVTLPGGVPNQIADDGYPTVWEDPQRIFFYSPSDRGTLRMDLESQEISHVAVPDTSEGDAIQYWVTGIIPSSNIGIGNTELPGGVNPAFLIVDLESGLKRTTETGIINASYVPGDFVTYGSGGNFGRIFLRKIDPLTGEFAGIAEPLLPSMPWWGQSVGSDGSLLFLPELVGSGIDAYNVLFLYDLLAGTIEELNVSIPGNGSIVRPAFSPDNRSIAFHVESLTGEARFVGEFDLQSRVYTQKTFGTARRDPDWSSDGSSLFFDGTFSAIPGIFRQSVDTSVEETLLIEGIAANPNLSLDGKWLAFSRDSDIYLYDFESGIESVVDSSDSNQFHPDFSPDSRYISFETFMSGVWQIAVRPLDGSTYSPLSLTNSRRPKWASDGKSIYFHHFPLNAIYRVPVTTDPIFRVTGEAQKVVEVQSTRNITWFDVSPDGKYLVIAGSEVGNDISRSTRNYSTLMWWQNWAQSLSKE